MLKLIVASPWFCECLGTWNISSTVELLGKCDCRLIATYFFIDNSADLIWTLDNLLYTYFLLLLGYISLGNDVFSKGYSTTAYIGFFCGAIQFIASMFMSTRNRVIIWLESEWTWMEWGLVHMYLALQICLLITILWTGRVFSKMEGDLVGKKKSKKSKHRKNHACSVF